MYANCSKCGGTCGESQGICNKCRETRRPRPIGEELCRRLKRFTQRFKKHKEGDIAELRGLLAEGPSLDEIRGTMPRIPDGWIVWECWQDPGFHLWHVVMTENPKPKDRDRRTVSAMEVDSMEEAFEECIKKIHSD